MADELDWLEMLLASERIEKWLSTVCGTQNSLSSKRTAMQQLAEATMEREAYAEEARQAEAVSRLTKVLASTEDLVLKQALVKFCTQLELASAFRHKSQVIKYGNLSVNIKERALGDGLGARVWVVAHTLCRELLAHPAVVAGKKVLEIGSGCGLCGIVAAKLGAVQVVLTDHEEKVLYNLRDCVAANSSAGSGDTFQTRTSHPAASSPDGRASDKLQALPASAATDPVLHSVAQGTAQPTDQDLFDPEDADSCDDLDDFFTADVARQSGACAGNTSWDHENMHVRHLDWEESLAIEQSLQTDGTKNSSSFHDCDAKQSGASSQTKADVALAPNVNINDKYDVVIGTDILYEAAHSKLVAAVLRHHVAMSGQALICCAVREQAIFDQFAKELDNRSMQHKIVAVQPKADDHGIVGKQHDYEGGFVLVAVRHAASSSHWHGSNL